VRTVSCAATGVVKNKLEIEMASESMVDFLIFIIDVSPICRLTSGIAVR
jgi:hypothetical protein